MNEKVSTTSKSCSIQPIPKEFRFPKRWVVGKKLYKTSQLQLKNETIEGTYHSILSKVKTLFAQNPQQAFERDYRKENFENAFAMHAFMSGSFYFYLECDFCYNYQLEYAFNNCRHEAEIRKQLTAYCLTGRAKEVALQPDFNTFFDNVLAVQNSKHIYSL